jgi:molybdate transport system ATP-binding protein
LYKQDPEYIILDNPLDHLDQESRKTITLQQLAQKTQLILIVNRQSDLFPFKVKKAQIKDNTFVLHQIKPIIKKQSLFETYEIPAPVEPIIYCDILVKMKTL